MQLCLKLRQQSPTPNNFCKSKKKSNSLIPKHEPASKPPLHQHRAFLRWVFHRTMELCFLYRNFIEIKVMVFYTNASVHPREGKEGFSLKIVCT